MHIEETFDFIIVGAGVAGNTPITTTPVLIDKQQAAS